jgi:hypothetical protein
MTKQKLNETSESAEGASNALDEILRTYGTRQRQKLTNASDHRS